MDIPAYLRRAVTALACGIGPRCHEDPDCLARTSDYISGQLAASGYTVLRQSFSWRGNFYDNLIAELPGASPSRGVLIIGTHYDTVRTTPGADDNASGVAGLLCLARALSGTRPETTIRFVFFCLEERPGNRRGSYCYAKGLKEKGDKVAGMICLEMIGYFCDGEGSQRYPLPFMKNKFPGSGCYIAMVGNLRSLRFTRAIAEDFRKNTDLPVFTLNAPAIVVGIDFSDHWSFGKLGYEALMVTDTAFYRNPHYHKPGDLPETLDYARMAKVVEGLAGAVAAWGRRSS